MSIDMQGGRPIASRAAHGGARGRIVRRVLVLTGVLLVAFAQAAIGEHDASDDDEGDRLGELENAYREIRRRHPDDPALEAFDRRLGVTDEVTGMIVEQLQSVRSDSLDGLLASTLGGKNRPSAKPAPSSQADISGDLVLQYEDVFAEPLGRPNVTEEEMQTLLAYYDARANTAKRRIAERGRVAADVRDDARQQIVKLCLVMPLLHVPDEQWGKAQIETIPEWMTRPEDLQLMERFSLQTQRPLTAYQFARFAARDGAAEPPPSRVDYLLDCGRTLVKRRQYHAGVRCLKAGIALAEADGQIERASGIRFELAGVFIKMRHPKLAAEAVHGVLEYDQDAADVWARAALRRLTYLYQAGQLEDVVREVPTYWSDKRADHIQPQLYYVAWAAYRRLGDHEQSARVSKLFLSQFGTHKLAADVYFADGIGQIAEGNYQQALKTLEIVKTRFPKSSAAKKAGKLTSRIEKMLEDQPAR